VAAPGAAPIGAGLPSGSYERHRPEETVLYTTLQAHWRSFLAETEAEDGSGCGLEHLARYLARPPVANGRLTALADGNVALRFKRPFSDGTEAVVFTPFELIERLLPLIPRPRKHIIRFHGILAPAAGYRAKVVPAPKASVPPRERPGQEPPARYRLPWAELLRRVFLVDALDCPRCHGRMRIVAAVTSPDAAERILRHLGENPAPPPIAGPRAPPGQDQAAE
jgi:Putative transposase